MSFQSTKFKIIDVDLYACQPKLQLLALEDSLYELTCMLHRHWGIKPVVLIDEYDTPVHEAYGQESPYHEDALDFYRCWLGKALKDNDHLERALLTGILRVALINLFSGVNSMPVDSMLGNRFSSYFGFTEQEVKQLLTQSGMLDHFAEVKRWYNGYQIGGVVLYNPWSVLSYLYQQGQARSYWSGSGDHGALAKAMIQCADASVLAGLESLVQGKSLEVSLNELTLFSGLGTRADSVWGLMVYAGYLTCERVEQGLELLATVSIPNVEVMVEVRGMINDWVSLSASRRSRELAYSQERTVLDGVLGALEHGHVGHLERVLATYLEDVASYYDFHEASEERFYHVFLLGMLVLLQDRYVIHSNKEMGLGRFDLVLAPKEATGKGVMIEIKRVLANQSLEEGAARARQQITDKRYDSFFRAHGVCRALHLGIAFRGKAVCLDHAWVDYALNEL